MEENWQSSLSLSSFYLNLINADRQRWRDGLARFDADELYFYLRANDTA